MVEPLDPGAEREQVVECVAVALERDVEDGDAIGTDRWLGRGDLLTDPAEQGAGLVRGTRQQRCGVVVSGQGRMVLVHAEREAQRGQLLTDRVVKRAGHPLALAVLGDAR